MSQPTSRGAYWRGLAVVTSATCLASLAGIMEAYAAADTEWRAAALWNAGLFSTLGLVVGAEGLRDLHIATVLDEGVGVDECVLQQDPAMFAPQQVHQGAIRIGK